MCAMLPEGEQLITPRTLVTRAFNGKYAEVTIFCGAGFDPKDPATPSCMVGVGTLGGTMRQETFNRVVAGFEPPKFAVQLRVPVQDVEQMREFARLLEKEIIPLSHKLDASASITLSDVQVKAADIRKMVKEAFDDQKADFADALEVAADRVIKVMRLPGTAEITTV